MPSSFVKQMILLPNDGLLLLLMSEDGVPTSNTPILPTSMLLCCMLQGLRYEGELNPDLEACEAQLPDAFTLVAYQVVLAYASSRSALLVICNGFSVVPTGGQFEQINWQHVDTPFCSTRMGAPLSTCGAPAPTPKDPD